MESFDAEKHPVVGREDWLEQRRALMRDEKELTRLRDRLSERRRALPWVRVETPYVFDTEQGEKTLADLFDGRSQLLVYHFMYPVSWSEGCKICSFWADGYDGIVPHLRQRDVTLTAVSRAALPRLQEFRRRMGWRFPWVSSGRSDFNRDFGVSFDAAEITSGRPIYNFGTVPFQIEEAPGVSVFVQRGDGEIFHTYSCYARGLDALNPAYQMLDLVPRGRDERALPHPMAWLRHHDVYGE